MQALKALVIFLGILIAVGLGVLAYALIARIPGGQGGGFGDVSVSLPAGCVIAQASVSEKTLVLRMDGPAQRGCQQVVLLDAKSGRVLGRVGVGAEP